MRAKILFLLKVAGISVGLFVIWPFIAKAYGMLLTLILRDFDPNYGVYRLKEKWFYAASLFLIPLCALVAATPKMRLPRKLLVIASGIFLSLVLDFTKVRLAINGSSVSYVIYYSLKWMSPLLVWLAASHTFLAEIFQPRISSSLPEREMYTCPICSAEVPHVVAHIRQRHGRKALKIKKVRRFLLKNPQVVS